MLLFTTSIKAILFLATYVTAQSTAMGKNVFAHYMVGSMTSSEAVTDVKDASNAGIDGFALNVQSTDSWSTSAISDLFDAANGSSGFKLFFSFDMTHFTNPSQFLPLIQQYHTNSAYFLQNGKPFVSTFNGGTLTFGSGTPGDGWNAAFRKPLEDMGISPFFVPDFDDWSGYPNGFISAFPVVDGAFSWESAWPEVSQGQANVSDVVDATVLHDAHSVNKVYMMALSSFQFKYLGQGQQWYRRGELNFAQRMGQILQLQPDLVEVVTWNDAGESHYVGNFWPEQIAGSNIGAYANGFDHKGWLQVLSPFIAAYKAGATQISSISPPSGAAAVGAMWYRTLLKSASCASSISGSQNADDALNFAIILPTDTSGVTINVYSNDNRIASYAGVSGLNDQSVAGLQAGGGQRVEVVDASGTTIASATGTKDVRQQSTNPVCNFNYEVVGLS
ncbi:glucan endo-1,3-alpha-glucosidase agn1 precursor, putative [Paecilomyces variotii No. 5]|uniref:Glucan endo-1,3-alpha-glucosidase agn1, putative n=1 Tax=Byssochlamys spectabilis (strain No. 5 / NBRC 109023) TaxID=1356009 RepID=V5G163_BYSSN|nr:glucan endo-1,3-alpha-glucosidase agn1 precursor, putative [Paecilomyces variotii No. 5]